MSESEFSVVAIGLSAGGLTPLHELLSNIRPPLNAAIIVVQHLHRDYKSMAAQLLQKYTSMPVLSVVNGMKLLPNHLYVLPENVMMTYENGCLWLRQRTTDEKVNRAIDILMDSMALQLGTRAFSIVLSGMDGDGSMGSLHIGEGGGTTIVQLPTTAEYPSMPEKALAVGKAQYSLTPKAIANLLMEQINSSTLI